MNIEERNEDRPGREEEMMRLEQRKIDLQKQLEETQGKARAETRQMDKQVKESEDRLRNLKLSLKEKEQENRISKLKIKELRRQLKHNQLQPLQ